MAIFKRPTMRKILEDELYNAEREVALQDERTYRLKVAYRQAELQLQLSVERRDGILTSLTEEDKKHSTVGLITP